MTTITMGGREIPLYYSVLELLAIQEQIGCTGLQLRDQVFGLEKIDRTGPEEPSNYRLLCATDPERMKKLGQLIVIIGNAGLEETGKEPDLTEKWVLRHMRPQTVLIYGLMAMNEINGGNQSEVNEEIQAKKNEGPVDTMVEAEEAKKAPGK